jgi:hypothetical protein
VVREPDGAIMAYCWSAGASTWEQIGEVVPPPAGGTKVRRRRLLCYGGPSAARHRSTAARRSPPSASRDSARSALPLLARRSTRPPPAPQEHHGKRWDFVFDVEMDDGPARKLAVNRGENPYMAARRFLEEEELPAHFTEQVLVGGVGVE